MRFIQSIYNRTIRGFLPRKVKVFNGIPANVGRLFDTTSNLPDYKQGSIAPLRQFVREGDQVVVVGGGWGITPVVAANQGAQVTVYEAGGDYADIVRKTVSLNLVDDRVEVIHSAVGPIINVYGDNVRENLNSTPVSALPHSDVIELDCEGAEMAILKRLEFRPRVAIVEVHPQYGIEIDQVQHWFRTNGYDIVSEFKHDDDPNVTLTAIRGAD